jgi:hypothetical protein
MARPPLFLLQHCASDGMILQVTFCVAPAHH